MVGTNFNFFGVVKGVNKDSYKDARKRESVRNIGSTMVHDK